MPRLGLRLGLGAPLGRSSGSGPVVPWTPAQLGADVIAWWDVSDTATVTQGAGLLTGVADKSGNGFHLSTVGTAPAYSATGINGHPAGVFVAASAQALGTATSLVLAQPFTVASLFKAGTLPDPSLVWDGDIASAATRANFLAEQNYTVVGAAINAGTITGLGVVLSAGTTYLSVIALNAASSTYNFNGSVPAVISPGSAGIVNGFRLSYSFDGAIGFCIIINRVLTTVERQALEGYINARFA